MRGYKFILRCEVLFGLMMLVSKFIGANEEWKKKILMFALFARKWFSLKKKSIRDVYVWKCMYVCIYACEYTCKYMLTLFARK